MPSLIDHEFVNETQMAINYTRNFYVKLWKSMFKLGISF